MNIGCLQEDELSSRTTELLEHNSSHVLRILVQYSQTSGKEFPAFKDID